MSPQLQLALAPDQSAVDDPLDVAQGIHRLSALVNFALELPLVDDGDAHQEQHDEIIRAARRLRDEIDGCIQREHRVSLSSAGTPQDRVAARRHRRMQEAMLSSAAMRLEQVVMQRARSYVALTWACAGGGD